MTACVPEMGIVNEPVGDKYPIDKLPGNNPVWCAEDGKLTDPSYVENATMISATPWIPDGWSMIGCLSRDKTKPETLAFPEVGMREIEVMRDMSPQYCLTKCAGYSVSNEPPTLPVCDFADERLVVECCSMQESNVSIHIARAATVVANPELLCRWARMHVLKQFTVDR